MTRCRDLTRSPRGLLQCVLEAGHDDEDPLSLHQIDPSGPVVHVALSTSRPPDPDQGAWSDGSAISVHTLGFWSAPTGGELIPLGEIPFDILVDVVSRAGGGKAVSLAPFRPTDTVGRLEIHDAD